MDESVESFVVAAPVVDVWRCVKELDFAKLTPDLVSDCEGGGAATVGSTRTNRYRDGSLTEVTLVEVSDVRMRLAWKSPMASEPNSKGCLLYTSPSPRDRG